MQKTDTGENLTMNYEVPHTRLYKYQYDFYMQTYAEIVRLRKNSTSKADVTRALIDFAMENKGLFQVFLERANEEE